VPVVFGPPVAGFGGLLPCEVVLFGACDPCELEGLGPLLPCCASAGTATTTPQIVHARMIRFMIPPGQRLRPDGINRKRHTAARLVCK
jgi:hypothetical protein